LEITKLFLLYTATLVASTTRHSCPVSSTGQA
jgi:hypothetical protein